MREKSTVLYLSDMRNRFNFLEILTSLSRRVHHIKNIQKILKYVYQKHSEDQ